MGPTVAISDVSREYEKHAPSPIGHPSRPYIFHVPSTLSMGRELDIRHHSLIGSTRRRRCSMKSPRAKKRKTDQKTAKPDRGCNHLLKNTSPERFTHSFTYFVQSKLMLRNHVYYQVSVPNVKTWIIAPSNIFVAAIATTKTPDGTLDFMHSSCPVHPNSEQPHHWCCGWNSHLWFCSQLQS